MSEEKGISSCSGWLTRTSAPYTLVQKEDGWVTQGAKYTLGTVAHALESMIALVDLVVASTFLLLAAATHFLLPQASTEWFDEKVFIPLLEYTADALEAMCLATSRIFTNFTGDHLQPTTEFIVAHTARSPQCKVLTDLTISLLTGKKQADPATRAAAAQSMKSENVAERTGALQLFGTLVGEKDQESYEAACAAATQGMENPGMTPDDLEERSKALSLFSALVHQKYAPAYEAVAAGATQGMKSADTRERRSALSLFWELVPLKHTQSNEPALLAAVQGMQNRGLTYDDLVERHKALSLFSRLVNESYMPAYAPALLAAVQSMQAPSQQDATLVSAFSERCEALSLFANLTRQQYAQSYEPALLAAVQGVRLSDQWERCYAYEVLIELVRARYPQAYEIAFNAAVNGMQSSELRERRMALLLLTALVQQGHTPAYAAAHTAATQGRQSEDGVAQEISVDLMTALVQQGHTPVYEAAYTTAAQRVQNGRVQTGGRDDVTISERCAGLMLLAALVQHRYMPAFETARRATQSIAGEHRHDEQVALRTLSEALAAQGRRRGWFSWPRQPQPAT